MLPDGTAETNLYTTRLFVAKAVRAEFAIVDLSTSKVVVPSSETATIVWTTTGSGASCTLYGNGKVLLPPSGTHPVNL